MHANAVDTQANAPGTFWCKSHLRAWSARTKTNMDAKTTRTTWNSTLTASAGRLLSTTQMTRSRVSMTTRSFSVLPTGMSLGVALQITVLTRPTQVPFAVASLDANHVITQQHPVQASSARLDVSQ